MSSLMEIVSLPAEIGRSPRLPGSTTVPSGKDLCAIASLRLCVDFSVSFASFFAFLERELLRRRNRPGAAISALEPVVEQRNSG